MAVVVEVAGLRGVSASGFEGSSWVYILLRGIYTRLRVQGSGVEGLPEFRNIWNTSLSANASV